MSSSLFFLCHISKTVFYDGPTPASFRIDSLLSFLQHRLQQVVDNHREFLHNVAFGINSATGGSPISRAVKKIIPELFFLFNSRNWNVICLTLSSSSADPRVVCRRWQRFHRRRHWCRRARQRRRSCRRRPLPATTSSSSCNSSWTANRTTSGVTRRPPANSTLSYRVAKGFRWGASWSL